SISSVNGTRRAVATTGSGRCEKDWRSASPASSREPRPSALPLVAPTNAVPQAQQKGPSRTIACPDARQRPSRGGCGREGGANVAGCVEDAGEGSRPGTV